MAYQALLLGTVENDGTGDTLRVGGAKINSNFTELYGNFPVDYADITGAPTTFAFADLTGVPEFALLASPAFSGIPAAPTAVKATNTTQLATTAFVQSQSDTPTFTGVVTVPTPAGADNSNTVATTSFVKALGYAPIASPTFTGLPAAPTASLGNNTTQLATTAFVTATKVVIDDAIALKANLASPTFTGVPAGPTAAANTNTTQLATTEFVRRDFVRPYTESAETIYTTSSAILIPHGLGVVPREWDTIWRCITAGQGYSVGDEVPGMEFEFIDNVLYGYQTLADTFNIVLLASAIAPLIIDKGVRIGVIMNTANWRVVARWR
jgi:hypothetical protein